MAVGQSTQRRGPRAEYTANPRPHPPTVWVDTAASHLAFVRSLAAAWLRKHGVRARVDQPQPTHRCAGWVGAHAVAVGQQPRFLQQSKA